MSVSPFINLYRTKDEAFYVRNSIVNTQYIFKGIHLLPNNPSKYIQVTQTPNGINLEDWQVNIVDFCTGIKKDITPYFFVDSLTNDIDGAPQLFWSLINIPFDFGWNFVYLEVNQLSAETFYSNQFMITDIYSEKVSMFHYRDIDETVYQSIGLQVYFLEQDKKTELTTYYELSSKNTVSKSIKTSLIDIYRTELMPKSLLINLTYVLESPVLYINTLRASLYEAIEIPKKKSKENFSMFDFMVSPNKNDNFFGLKDYNGINYGTDYDIDSPILDFGVFADEFADEFE